MLKIAVLLLSVLLAVTAAPKGKPTKGELKAMFEVAKDVTEKLEERKFADVCSMMTEDTKEKEDGKASCFENVQLNEEMKEEHIAEFQEICVSVLNNLMRQKRQTPLSVAISAVNQAGENPRLKQLKNLAEKLMAAHEFVTNEITRQLLIQKEVYSDEDGIDVEGMKAKFQEAFSGSDEEFLKLGNFVVDVCVIEDLPPHEQLEMYLCCSKQIFVSHCASKMGEKPPKLTCSLMATYEIAKNLTQQFKNGTFDNLCWMFLDDHVKKHEKVGELCFEDDIEFDKDKEDEYVNNFMESCKEVLQTLSRKQRKVKKVFRLINKMSKKSGQPARKDLEKLAEFVKKTEKILYLSIKEKMLTREGLYSKKTGLDKEAIKTVFQDDFAGSDAQFMSLIEGALDSCIQTDLPPKRQLREYACCMKNEFINHCSQKIGLSPPKEMLDCFDKKN